MLFNLVDCDSKKEYSRFSLSSLLLEKENNVEKSNTSKADVLVIKKDSRDEACNNHSLSGFAENINRDLNSTT